MKKLSNTEADLEKGVAYKKKRVTPQDGTGNIDWCKCEYECKPIATFTESFYLLLRLKSQSAKGASYHSHFMCNYPAISHKC